MIERKRSKQRDAIYDFLKTTKDHPDASVIYETIKKDIPNISLGTVYRNLSLLADENKIIKLDSKGGAVHYDADTTSHHHIICKSCGRIDDIFYDLSKDIKKLAKDKDGYQLEAYSLICYGLCSECLKENN